jgi:hypothetical protein
MVVAMRSVAGCSTTRVLVACGGGGVGCRATLDAHAESISVNPYEMIRDILDRALQSAEAAADAEEFPG